MAGLADLEQPVHDQLAQLLGVGGDDPQQQVLRPADVVQLEHLRLGQQPPGERVDPGPLLPELDPDHGLDPEPQPVQVDVRVEAPQVPLPDQPRHPGVDGGGRQADPGGQLLVGQPSVLRQGGQELEVDSVEGGVLGHWAKSIRWKRREGERT